LIHLGGAVAIGPILLGIKKPVYLLGPGNTVNDVVNITAMAVVEAQRKASNKTDKYSYKKITEEVSLN